MKDTKVIIVNDFAHINGGASQVALLGAIALAQRGYAVSVFSAVAPVMPELQEAGVEVVCTAQHEILDNPSKVRASVQGLWNSKAERMFGELLDGFDPERTIVHLHSWTKALSSSVIREAARREFKVVCTLHDYFAACPNGGFYDYRHHGICRLTPLSSKCVLSNCDARNYQHKLWRLARQVVQRRFGQMPQGIFAFISVSNLSEAILKPFLPEGAKIRRVANPICIERDARTLPHDNESFVFVGRIAREKGPSIFAKAAKSLDCEAIFVGDGYAAADIADDYASAKITGWLAREEVGSFLKKARALVFPSLLYESDGLVVKEAAAIGVPAIVSDATAAKELIINGVTGLVFRSGDVEDLAAKMRVLREARMADRMGLAAYERYWSSPSTMDSHVDRLEEVYRELVRSSLDLLGMS